MSYVQKQNKIRFISTVTTGSRVSIAIFVGITHAYP